MSEDRLKITIIAPNRFKVYSKTIVNETILDEFANTLLCYKDEIEVEIQVIREEEYQQ